MTTSTKDSIQDFQETIKSQEPNKPKTRTKRNLKLKHINPQKAKELEEKYLTYLKNILK